MSQPEAAHTMACATTTQAEAHAQTKSKKARKNKHNRKHKSSPVGCKAEHCEGEVKIHVGNLPTRTSNHKLAALFTPYGAILECFVFKRPHAVKNTRSAIVRMASVSAATEAISNLDGTTWKKEVLRVRLSLHNETPMARSPTTARSNGSDADVNLDEYDEDCPLLSPFSSAATLIATQTFEAGDFTMVGRRMMSVVSHEGSSQTGLESARASFDLTSASDCSISSEASDPTTAHRAEEGSTSGSSSPHTNAFVHDPYNQAVWGFGWEECNY